MNHSAQTSHPAASDIVDYIIVVSNEDDYHASYHHFAEKVNRKLKAGYHLLGQPVSMNRVLCQAMVRYAGAAHGGDTSAAHKSQAAHR